MISSSEIISSTKSSVRRRLCSGTKAAVVLESLIGFNFSGETREL